MDSKSFIPGEAFFRSVPVRGLRRRGGRRLPCPSAAAPLPPQAPHVYSIATSVWPHERIAPTSRWLPLVTTEDTAVLVDTASDGRVVTVVLSDSYAPDGSLDAMALTISRASGDRWEPLWGEVASFRAARRLVELFRALERTGPDVAGREAERRARPRAA